MNLQKVFFSAAALAFTALLCLSYANHFDNGFQFDDFHTIVNNTHIRDIGSIGRFFTDIETYGTNPDNRTFNPVLVTLNAIDYWIGGGLKPKVFHISIFVSYLLLGAFLHLFFKTIFDLSRADRWNSWFAMLATAFYMQHAANAETINYIIMRSDSFSTLMIVASFILYFDASARRFKLHYITFFLGLGTKATGFIFAPLLAAYILLFEEQMPFWGALLITKNFRKTVRFITKATPILLIAALVFHLERHGFKQGNPLPSSGSGFSKAFDYFVTQWYVIAHYLGNFILPLDLSVDTDFSLITNPLQRKVLLSLALLLAIAGFGIYASRKQETRPIAFGIIWFFFALAPTSSFIPFGQIANDHRTFFPYIGLVMAAGWWIALKIIQIRDNTETSKAALPAAAALYLLVIGLHAYGTYQRNIIWDSAESLWGDAAVKSPNNARVQLNYGLALMEKGKYDDALLYYNKALALMPNWSYVHINMGILKNAMGKPEEGEEHFKKALQYHALNPNSYYYYAVFLEKHSRAAEALKLIEQGIKISPNYDGFHELYQRLKTAQDKKLDALLQQESDIDKNPQEAAYINLSLSYYNAGEFQRSIAVCEKVLRLAPGNVVAYNNICSAYNALAEWEKAQEACGKALALDPSYELAKNNLRVASEGKSGEKK
ncbi:tetratricopeptide repeat protein [Candidatus Electronema sp. JM]|uniref:tetratricopeptide repeat protein n=1 Tax=Candidatus Electronema sp. JM TaxID=3401571 RepID=UPI003AA7D572